MSAKPERNSRPLTDPVSDDSDQLRALVSAMLSGSYREESYLWDVTSLCQSKPEFARRLLSLIERYNRLGQMPAAQYKRIRQKIETSLPAKERPAATAASSAPGSRGAGAQRTAGSSTVTAAVPERNTPPRLAPEATVTAPLPGTAPETPRTAQVARAAGPMGPPALDPVRIPEPPRIPEPADALQPTHAPEAPPPLATAATRRRTVSGTVIGNPPGAGATPARHPEPPKMGLIIEPGAVLRERYELEELLGCGGMAAVYKARDRYRASLSVSDCHVALKIVAPHSAMPADDAALGREFHNAQQLSHPNIINVYEIDHEAGATFYTMELLEGEKLDQLLVRVGGPLPLAQSLAVIRDIGTAIEHAHTRGILHADLKPQNVFITFGGQIRVLDFGGVSLPAPEPWIGEPHGNGERYRTATPAYASCEQLEGQQVDPRDDIYALGCIAYELLTGRHPFDGLTALQARAQHLRPRRAGGLTAAGWRALRRALAWRRDQRPGRIGPWLEQLGVGSAATRLPPSYELRTAPPRGGRAGWAALAAALLVCVGAGIVLGVPGTGRFDQLDWSGWHSSTQDSLHLWRSKLLGLLASWQGQDLGPSAAPAPLLPSQPLQASQPPLAMTSPQGGPQVDPTANTAPPSAQGAIAARPRAGHLRHSEPAESSAQTAAAAAVAPGPASSSPPATQSPAHPAIEFSSTSYKVENNSPAARVVVRRSGGSQDELRFVWWTLDDTAKADVDYAPLGRRTEDIPPGQDQVTLYVPIISNPLRHETATFYVALGRPGAEELPPSARASVTIERGG